jgi:hypothetical protein
MNKCKWCDQEIFIINECNDNCECDRCKGFCNPLHYFKYLDRFGKFGEKMTERKIVEYEIIISCDYFKEIGSGEDEFEQRINRSLSEDWCLYGNTEALLYSDGSLILTQAMVKYED